MIWKHHQINTFIFSLALSAAKSLKTNSTQKLKAKTKILKQNPKLFKRQK